MPRRYQFWNDEKTDTFHFNGGKELESYLGLKDGYLGEEDISLLASLDINGDSISAEDMRVHLNGEAAMPITVAEYEQRVSTVTVKKD